MDQLISVTNSAKKKKSREGNYLEKGTKQIKRFIKIQKNEFLEIQIFRVIAKSIFN